MKQKCDIEKELKEWKRMKIMLDTYKTEKTNGNGTSHKVNHKYFNERRIFCKVCLLVRTSESFKDHRMPGGGLR